MDQFEFLNRTTHRHIIPYLASSCEETINYYTSRFHSYQGISTWVSLQDSPLSHTMGVNYALSQGDYLKLTTQLNFFSDERYPLLVPEFYIAQSCTYRNNEIEVDTPPWDLTTVQRGLFFIGHYLVAFDISGVTPGGDGKTTIRGSIDAPVQGTGLFIPLKAASVFGGSQAQTTTANATTSVVYEFAVPRDYTQEGFTTADFPKPRGEINREISLPDFSFKGRRVRGRRGFVSRDSIGWGKRWGLSWGGLTTQNVQRKDNIYQASYNENMDVRYDYRIKNVVSKALLDTALIDLLDDDGKPFPAMIESDQLSISYEGYTYSCNLVYSKRTLKVE